MQERLLNALLAPTLASFSLLESPRTHQELSMVNSQALKLSLPLSFSRENNKTKQDLVLQFLLYNIHTFYNIQGF